MGWAWEALISITLQQSLKWAISCWWAVWIWCNCNLHQQSGNCTISKLTHFLAILLLGLLFYCLSTRNCARSSIRTIYHINTQKSAIFANFTHSSSPKLKPLKQVILSSHPQASFMQHLPSSLNTSSQQFHPHFSANKSI